MSSSEERRPRGDDWREAPLPPAMLNMPRLIAASAWVCGPVQVLSSLSEMKMPDGDGSGPQWLVSITHKRKRPKQHEVRRTLRAFGMTEAEEDNHGQGNARSFFLVVDPARRVGCECKSDETTMRDSDGYKFTVADDPAECGGCLLVALHGRPCPRHGAK